MKVSSLTPQYTYEQLGKMDVEHDEQVNFYGVIIDANFPFK